MIDFSWLDSDFTLRLCLTLLHSLWQFILLALMACLVGVLIKRRGVQWLYSINVIALVIGLAMLPVTFALLSGHQAADNVPTTAFTQTGSNQVGLAPPTEQMEQTPLKQHAESSSAQTTIIGNLGGCVVRDGSRADAVAINVSNRSRQSTRRAGARFD